MKKGYYGPIETLTTENTYFRKVLYTGAHMQLVLMALQPNEEIGEEVHEENDQFFRVESGSGSVIINGNEYTVRDGDAVIVPAGATHNVINRSSDAPLQLYTIYAPPHHKDGTIHSSKDAAVHDDEDFDGTLTE